MSRKSDLQLAEDRRLDSIEHAREVHYKLGRVIDMFEERFTDAEIAQALGWRHKKTAERCRKLLQLGCGQASGRRRLL